MFDAAEFLLAGTGPVVFVGLKVIIRSALVFVLHFKDQLYWLVFWGIFNESIKNGN